MANEPLLTLVGNATADAELAYGASGTARCSWTIAVTPRIKQNEIWSDGETAFYRCTAWRQLAESSAESIKRGMRLLVHGRLAPRSYESNGEKRVSLDITVEHVGAEMLYSTVATRKVERTQMAGAGAPSRPQGSQGASRPQPIDDPWKTPLNDDDIPF